MEWLHLYLFSRRHICTGNNARSVFFCAQQTRSLTKWKTPWWTFKRLIFSKAPYIMFKMLLKPTIEKRCPLFNQLTKGKLHACKLLRRWNKSFSLSSLSRKGRPHNSKQFRWCYPSQKNVWPGPPPREDLYNSILSHFMAGTLVNNRNLFSYTPSSETQGLPVGTMRYFRASDIFGAKVYFKDVRAKIFHSIDFFLIFTAVR